MEDSEPEPQEPDSVVRSAGGGGALMLGEGAFIGLMCSSQGCDRRPAWERETDPGAERGPGPRTGREPQ